MEKKRIDTQRLSAAGVFRLDVWQFEKVGCLVTLANQQSYSWIFMVYS